MFTSQKPQFMSLVPNDQPSSDRPLSIAAAANLVGVTTHTLRKWESRHSIVVPQRTDTGRRYYDADQVKALQLVKQLLDFGHTLSLLAALSTSELEALLAEHDSSGREESVASVDLVGPNISLQLNGWNGITAEAYGSDVEAWLSHPLPVNHGDALVFETNTLPENTVAALIALRRDHYDHVVVIARMSSRRTRRHLRTEGITAIDTLVPISTLCDLLESPTEPAAIAPLTKQKFTANQLAAVAAMTPSIDCECPNHIAQLLIDISAFEQYCRECKDADPAEVRLHAHLGDITGQARGLFETALIAVAEADNLDLSNLETTNSFE